MQNNENKTSSMLHLEKKSYDKKKDLLNAFFMHLISFSLIRYDTSAIIPILTIIDLSRTPTSKSNYNDA